LAVKQKSSRRQEVQRQPARRRINPQRATVWQQFIQPRHPVSFLVWAGFYVATVFIMQVGSKSMPRRLGELIDNDITARVAFEIVDAVATQDQKQVASASAPDVYLRNAAPLASIRGKLTELLAIAKASAGDLPKFSEQAAAKGWTITAEGFEALKPFCEEARGSEYEALVSNLTAELSRTYIVQKPDTPVREATPRTSILRSMEQERPLDTEVLTNQIRYITDTRAVRQIAEQAAARHFPAGLHAPVVSLISETLLGPSGKGSPVLTPLWRYDAAATAEAIKEARERVRPITIRKQPGDLLVRAGTVLSLTELELLKTEHEEFLKAEKAVPELRRKKLLTELGMAVVILMVTVGLAAYTAAYQDRVFEKPGRTLGLAGLLVAVVLGSRLLDQVQFPTHPPAEFAVGLVVIAAMLLTIAYNQRFAFGCGAGLAILVTLACRGDFGLFLTLMVGMAVSVFALNEIRTRSKVVAVGAMAGGGALVASLATGLLASQDLKYVIAHALAAGGTALFAGFIVQGILPHFERMFSIATSMTLLEWCDASRPLLRRLAQEAPGTYSHSLVISQMAEEAAETVGANGLLARVGALYHDIGKTQKSAYFVENQEARMNRHDRLSPTMSLLVITGHVKDGLEMARAYGLPRALHQFILEHHGTTVVKYFHHAASEAAARNTGKHDREVSESEFRYPGPRPRTRESAILMLCDGCEGAVRALSEPTPGRIESTVHMVVMDRLTDGQFDDCEITLRELNMVEQSIVKSLCAIHHGRIKYPTDIRGSSGEGRRAAEPGSAESREEDQALVPASSAAHTREVARQA